MGCHKKYSHFIEYIKTKITNRNEEYKLLILQVSTFNVLTILNLNIDKIQRHFFHFDPFLHQVLLTTVKDAFDGNQLTSPILKYSPTYEPQRRFYCQD